MGVVVVAAMVAGLSEEPGARLRLGRAGATLARARCGCRCRCGVGGLALPLFFICGTFHHELGLGSADSWTYFASVVALVVLCGWIYAATGGRRIAVVAAHTSQNVAAALWSVSAGRTVEITVLAVLATAVCFSDRDRMLSPVTGHPSPPS